MKPGTEKEKSGIFIFLTTVALHSFVINFVDKHPRLLSAAYLACSGPVSCFGAAVEM